MTFTGQGGVTKQTSIFSYQDETSSYSSKLVQTGRSGVPSGRIGPMIFDDEAGEYSYAYLGSYKEVSRNRTR